MDERILKVKELFGDVVPGFGITHAKVYAALLSGEVKTARQLGEETGISHNKVYSILKDLMREKIVLYTNTNPANYHVKDPPKVYENLVNRKIALLEKLPEQFDKILNEETTITDEKEYLIKFGGQQTKLFDQKNKAQVNEAEEARQVIRQLNIYVNKLEPKKEYNLAVYR
ncbi:MAG: hypothetical protein NTW59_04120 [Candidatus Diapherotrites archaeon]|nr:hypothetical protein [Candidatus Diapherotrites archaeon]